MKDISKIGEKFYLRIHLSALAHSTALFAPAKKITWIHSHEICSDAIVTSSTSDILAAVFILQSLLRLSLPHIKATCVNTNNWGGQFNQWGRRLENPVETVTRLSLYVA